MTNNSVRKVMLFTGLSAVVLLSSACGSDNPTKDSSNTTAAKAKVACATATVAGAGSTFVQTIVQQWVKDYGTACPGATVNYQGVGSGAGIQQFIAGTVDFGASDVVMKPEEETAASAKVGEVLHIPWTSGAIAIMVNLQGVTSVKLTPEALAGIYAGKITKWDDAALATDNKGLPSKPIAVVHRSDASGTTSAFTSYLKAAAPAVWTVGAGKDVPWPTGTGAKGSDGVTASVKQTDGAIGYAELSFAKGAGLSVASLKNAAGSFVEPTNAGVAAALSGATIPTDLKVSFDFMPKGATAYPLSTLSWVIVAKKPADPAKAKLLNAFITYALTEGQKAAPSLFYAPLPSELLTKGAAAAAAIGAS
jgi:phosphate transport system substrate-binding protein